MFDFPIFDMPLVGHRFMFAFDAILHVFISHGAAVGGSIILVLAQWFAIKNNDRKFDELAYKIFFTFFVPATAVGALTGIGIWIHVNIINPAAIGAWLRVFFWKWFIEWQADLSEVASQGVISELLSGKRDLNVRQVRALSERFSVPAQVFIG